MSEFKGFQPTVAQETQASVKDVEVKVSDLEQIKEVAGLYTGPGGIYRLADNGQPVCVSGARVWGINSEIEAYRNVILDTNYMIGMFHKHYPFFSSLLSRLTIIYTNYKVPTAATDGRRLYISPEFFMTLDAKNRIAIICHELLHCALGHFVRKKDRSHLRWNYATDYEINQILVHEHVQGSTIWSKDEIKKLGALYDEKYLGMGSEQIYELLPETKCKVKICKGGQGAGSQCANPGGKGDGQGKDGDQEKDGGMGGAPIDDMFDPETRKEIAKALGYDDVEIDEVEDAEEGSSLDDQWKKYAGEAIKNLDRQSAQGAGTNPGGYLREALLRRLKPQVDWKSELKRFIGKAEDTWQHKFPARRWVGRDEYRYSQRQRKDALKNAVVAIDVSGSISQDDLTLFINETLGIIDAAKVKTTSVVWWDVGVEQVDVIKYGERKKLEGVRPRGGGGTMFDPVHQWIDDRTNFAKMDPDVVVVMTDGYWADQKLPKKPKWGPRTLWIVVNNPDWSAPYGAKVLHVSHEAFKK